MGGLQKQATHAIVFVLYRVECARRLHHWKWKHSAYDVHDSSSCRHVQGGCIHVRLRQASVDAKIIELVEGMEVEAWNYRMEQYTK